MVNWSLYKDVDINPEMGTPESVCSKACGRFEYVLQKELHCCWECRSCREYEIIVDNMTSCKACSLLSWPDSNTKTVCKDIPPEFMQLSDSITIGLLLITSFGILLTGGIGFLFVYNRKAKLIKASSRDLMVFIMIGIFLAFLCIFAIIAKPSFTSCHLIKLGFNLSVCLIYGPLFVKTNRVYRIFSAGKRGNKRPAFISSRVQLTATIFILAGQVRHFFLFKSPFHSFAQGGPIHY